VSIAVDCRELTKPHLSALALILLSLIPRLSHTTEVVLLSDVRLPAYPELDGLKNLSWGRRCPGGLSVVRYQRWMARIVDAHSIDALYEVDHYALFRTNATRITSIHDLYVLDGPERYPVVRRLAYRIATARTLRNSDSVLAVSAFTRSRLEAHFGVHPNVRMVRIGVDQAADAPTDRPKGVPDGFILSLGRLSAWKGTLRLLDFYLRNADALGHRTLVLAGRCDPREAAVQEAVERATAGGRVIWLGYVSDPQREWLLRNTDLLCYPSTYDGFGLPPVEAAIRGTPCLMSDLAVLREATGDAGRYVNFDGPEDEVLEHVLEALDRGRLDPCIREVAQIAQQYTWDEMVQALARASEA